MKKRKVCILSCTLILLTLFSVQTTAAPSIYPVSSNAPPLSIHITTPEPGNLYVMGAQMIPLPLGFTVIVGPITIRAEIEGPTTDEQGSTFYQELIVAFYIDGELQMNDSLSPYECSWWDITFGRHTIEVKLFQDDTLLDTDSMQVFKIF